MFLGKRPFCVFLSPDCKRVLSAFAADDGAKFNRPGENNSKRPRGI